MNEFALPEDVTSPRLMWHLTKVLFRGDHNDHSRHDPDGYSIAVGKWEGHACLAIRWNCNESRPVGNPQSRGLPTWFILPDELVEPVLATLSNESRVIARSLLA